MRSILKRGQKVQIFKPFAPGVSTGVVYQKESEGEATLISLVRKCHTAGFPFETWMVQFDDDGEPVQRDILVTLPAVSGMASSLARSPESRNLIAFMAAAELSDDWADPSGHGVTAYITGKVLNNEVGAVELDGRKINEELLVHLEFPGTKIVLNLNTLLVLASGYVRFQHNIATEAVRKNQE